MKCDVCGVEMATYAQYTTCMLRHADEAQFIAPVEKERSGPNGWVRRWRYRLSDGRILIVIDEMSGFHSSLSFRVITMEVTGNV